MLKIEDLINGLETSAYRAFPIDTERYELGVCLRLYADWHRDVPVQLELYDSDERVHSWLHCHLWKTARKVQKLVHEDLPGLVMSNTLDPVPSTRAFARIEDLPVDGGVFDVHGEPQDLLCHLVAILSDRLLAGAVGLNCVQSGLEEIQ